MSFIECCNGKSKNFIEQRKIENRCADFRNVGPFIYSWRLLHCKHREPTFDSSEDESAASVTTKTSPLKAKLTS